jgi:hypothetical protein
MPYPNGTIGCLDPAHNVGEPPPPGLSREDHIRWVVDHAPPLTAEQRGQLAMLLRPPGPDR